MKQAQQLLERDLGLLFIKLVYLYPKKFLKKLQRGVNQNYFILSIITDDNCQYWKNLQDMTLSSPNYPKWYNADGVGCEWLLSAPEGSIIALEFNHFHVRCLLDFD